MKLSDEAIRRLGLDPATATDAEVSAAILASVTDDSGTGSGDGGGDGGTADDGNPQSQPETQPTQPTGEPATAPTTTPDTGDGEGTTTTTTDQATPAIPEGMALIDAATLEELKSGVKIAATLQQREVDTERNRILDDAIRAGKFPKARRAHYEALMKADPDGTKNLIASLAAGVIPVTEIGTQGGDDDGTGIQGDAYPESWKPAVAASRKGIGSRVKVVND